MSTSRFVARSPWRPQRRRLSAAVGGASAAVPPTSEPAPSEPAATDTVAPSGSTAAGESAWEKVVPGGECECADGSEFSFWAREADPAKVVLYLDGGGACLDAETCAFTDPRGDTIYDYTVQGENPGSDDLLAIIDANEAAIEAAGVVQHSYTAPSDSHGILEFPHFYELEVNGVKLVDWVAALVAGAPLDDVHCDDCERPER